MPTYTANIQLQDALVQDYALLNKELRQRSFSSSANAEWQELGDSVPYLNAVNFRREGSLIQEVVTDLVVAAKKTGKPFSFTVLKEKEK